MIFILILASCAEEQFAPPRQDESQTANPIQTSSSTSCSSFTLIKPKVDFLFLWDNSTSSVFINSQTKTALNNTIDLISSRFDYHIMMAPLVVNSSNVNYEARFLSDTPAGLGSSALAMKIDRTYASAYLESFSAASGSYEEGVKRSVSLIKSNISNGIFRPNSNLVIVVMSNQDDSSWHNYPVAAADRLDYTNEQAKQLLCLRGNYTPSSGNCTGSNLNSLQMRFMSISAFNPEGTTCGGISSWKQGTTYQEMSKKIYLTPYANGVQQNDQHTRSDGKFDSYDICSQSNFSHIFDGINASINSTLLEHKYNRWPVATSGSANIDPNEVSVFKDGQELPRLFPPVSSGSHGFSFDNVVQTRNTRYSPSSGEPFTGYMVRLYGNGRVTYPECMVIKTQTPKEYFGYVQLQSKPLESSITLRINGVTIPNSSTNGWQLLKSGSNPTYYSSLNIKIVSPSDFSAGTPAVNKSGYFLRLNGTAVHSNGAQIELSYDPGA
jgi:hypothetical protein